MRPRRLAILRAIADYTAAHERPPTQREMADLAGIVTTDMVRNELSVLRRMGLVKMLAMVPRSCVLTEAGRAAIMSEDCHRFVQIMSSTKSSSMI